MDTPIQCYKCWHYDHLAVQYKSKVDLSKLCIKCGKEGHKVADCNNTAHFILCVEQTDTKNIAHFAGSSKCAVFREALLKVKNRRT